MEAGSLTEGGGQGSLSDCAFVRMQAGMDADYLVVLFWEELLFAVGAECSRGHRLSDGFEFQRVGRRHLHKLGETLLRSVVFDDLHLQVHQEIHHFLSILAIKLRVLLDFLRVVVVVK